MNAQVSREYVRDIRTELNNMHVRHMEETEEFYADAADVDYDEYARREDNGGFILFVARAASSRAIGNLGFYLTKDNHADVLQAWEDVFYVDKEYRKDGIGGMLVKYAESYLESMGAGYIRMSSKHPQGAPDLGPFFNKQGYAEVCVIYGKKLGEV